MTPMFFPTMLSKVKRSLPDLTNIPVLSANTTLEKSTIFMRDSEIVVDPHSMSAISLTIASNRVALVYRHPFYRECHVQLRFKRSCYAFAKFDCVTDGPSLSV